VAVAGAAMAAVAVAVAAAHLQKGAVGWARGWQGEVKVDKRDEHA
jgi:hypothetical protein